MGLRPSYSAHVRWCERGAPLWSCGDRAGLRGRPAVSHISRKTSEMPRISCTQIWKEPRVRLSLRKGAGSAGNPRNYTGNRGVGHPAIGAGMESKSMVQTYPAIGSRGLEMDKLFDVGGGFLETMEGCRIVLDPELGAALLQVGLHHHATRQRLLLIRLIFRGPGRGSLRRIMP